MRYQITAPVPHVVSTIAGVAFADSKGETDSEAAVAYFRRHGYRVEEFDETPPPPAEAPDPTPSGSEQQETPPAGGSSPAAPAKPAKSATKVDWVAYAVAMGMPQDEAESLTRDALVERFAEPAGGAA